MFSGNCINLKGGGETPETNPMLPLSSLYLAGPLIQCGSQAGIETCLISSAYIGTLYPFGICCHAVPPQCLDSVNFQKGLPIVKLFRTKNRLMVTIHSKDVMEILALYRISEIDFPPHFLVRLMHSFPMMYNTI